ncbi:MAG: PGF-CTERM sorting domain-containing protein [Halobacterium sp.]
MGSVVAGVAAPAGAATATATSESQPVAIYADSDNTLRVLYGNGSTSSLGVTAVVAGPAKNLDGDARLEVPYVNSSKKVNVVDTAGERQGLGSATAYNNKYPIAAGDWDGDGQAAVFYANESKTLTKVEVGSSNPEAVLNDGTAIGSHGAVGVADFDGDSDTDLLFLGDSSEKLKYYDGATVNNTGFSSWGSNSGGWGVGPPADFDGDGQPRVPVVDGSQYLKLVGPDGSTETFVNSSYKVSKTHVAAVDWNESTDALELLHVDSDVLYSASLNGPVSKLESGIAVNIEVGVLPVLQSPPPEISDFSLSNPTGRELAVSFNSSEELGDLRVNVTNGTGSVVASLTEGEFTEQNASGTWTYDATYTVSQDGDYTATLVNATAVDGQELAVGQSDSVYVDTQVPRVIDGSAEPAVVEPNTTIDNQEVYVVLANVSADGDTDKHFVEFPNDLASGLSLNSASVNGSASIASSAELVEGFDDDNTTETVRFQTDTDEGGVVDLRIGVDISVPYPGDERNYWVDARVVDSNGETDTMTDVTHVTAGNPPSISSFDATNPSGSTIEVSFQSSEQLSNVSVCLCNASVKLTESDFSVTASDGNYTYTAKYEVSSDGEYTAHLMAAADEVGLDGSSDQKDTVQMSTSSGGGDTTDSTSDGTTDSTSDGTADSTSDSSDTTDSTDGTDTTNAGSATTGDATPPDVRRFALAADGRDVDLVVTTSERVASLSVNVSGAVEGTLSRSSFRLVDTRDGYTYRANVSWGRAGLFRATLAAAVDAAGNDAAAGQTASVAVAQRDPGEPRALASPPWTGVGDSVHTVSIPVTANDSVAGGTLQSVAVGYGAEFFDAGGSVSSVSDDQNVAVLRVVAANGTTKAALGGTDAVTVNVADGAVHVNLSDVDSARTPRLAVGDRVVVRLRPVTNPGRTGEYSVGATLGTAGGATSTTTESVRIRSDEGSAVDAAYVTPDEEQATLDLDADDVASVTVDVASGVTGVVRASVPASPEPVDALERPVVAAVNVSLPERAEGANRTVRIAVPATAVPADGSRLRVARYNASAESWQYVNTSVDAASDSRVALEASVSETSLFAVTAPAGAAEYTTTATPTTTSTATTERTTTPARQRASTSAPGFGALTALAAAAAAALFALRRR